MANGLSKYDPGQELSSIDFNAMLGGPLVAAIEAQAQAAASTLDFIKRVGFTPDTEDETTGELTPGAPIYVTFKYPKMVVPYQAAGQGEVLAVAVTTKGSDYVVGDTIPLTGGLGGSGAIITVTAVSTPGGIEGVTVENAGNGYDDGEDIDIPDSAATGTGAKVKITANDAAAQPAQFDQMKLEVPLLTIVETPYIRIDEVDIDFHAKITSMEYKRVGSDFKISSGFSHKSTISGGASAGGSFFKLSAKGWSKYSNTTKFTVNASYQRSVKGGFKIDKTYQLGVKINASQDEMPAGMEKLLGILEDAIVAQPDI